MLEEAERVRLCHLRQTLQFGVAVRGREAGCGSREAKGRAGERPREDENPGEPGPPHVEKSNDGAPQPTEG
jgi:hypothetical protein